MNTTEVSSSGVRLAGSAGESGRRPYVPAPAVQALLDEVDRAGNDLDSMSEASVCEIRALREAWAQRFLWYIPVENVWNLPISADGGVWARIYRPVDHSLARGGRLPVVVFYHGGGWALGSVASYDSLARELTRRIPAMVVSVEYRLAPRYRFPTAVDDADLALGWVREHIEAYGGDPGRVAVAGDSAGGNLATVIAIRNRDRGGAPLVMQALFYPSTDVARTDWPSYEQYDRGHLLTTRAVETFRAFYLPDRNDWSQPEASPLRTRDLSGLPAALVITAGCDPLRDEGEAYANRLASAGVPVIYRLEPEMIHGFLGLYNLQPGVSAYAEAALAFAAGVIRQKLVEW